MFWKHLEILYKIFCRYCTNNMDKLWKCCTDHSRLLAEQRYAIILLILCYHCSNIVKLVWNLCVNIEQIFTDIMHKTSKYYIIFYHTCLMISFKFEEILPSSDSTQLNSISIQTKAEFNLISSFRQATHPSARPPTHPPNRESNKMEQDFKYFNWRVQILAKLTLNSFSTPAQPQLNLILTQLKLLSLALLSSSLFFAL